MTRGNRTTSILAFGAALVALAAAANPGGWRTRVVSRLLRVDNHPRPVPRPPGFLPTAPQGFTVSLFDTNLTNPRWLATAPNGDVFVAESGLGAVVALRATPDFAAAAARRTFADHLNQPFGIAFTADFVYIANTNEVVRFRYDRRTSERLGPPEHVLDLPGKGYRQHWTRSIAIDPRANRLFVSVGSETNESIESDPRRGAILVSDLDGRQARVFASGLRNAVGLAFNPSDGSLWATVNERDNLGDDTPPDYFTQVQDGGFYGWPYSYIGSHVDNRVSARPDLVAKAVVPDVLLRAHAAPLQVAFYTGVQFPPPYGSGAFIAEHGSWNRRERSGYDVVFVPFAQGRPAGAPVRFLTGFAPDPRGTDVYGRVVGVTVAADGSLLVSDDDGRCIWRVSYTERGSPLPSYD